jgi:hypothetical protein
MAAARAAPEGSRSVVLDDIRSKGARLRGRDLPDVSAELLLRIGWIELRASVTWVGDDKCEVSFATPLDERAIQSVKMEGSWGHMVGIV